MRYSQGTKNLLAILWLFLIFPRLTLVSVTHIFRIFNHSVFQYATYKFSRFVPILDVPTAAILVIFKWGKGCAIAQMISRRLLNSEARVHRRF
jgi:hypothetical protein